MEFDKRDTIEKLKLEISMICDGGYNPTVREPRKEPRIFRDSMTCLKMRLEEKQLPCQHCFLIQFVPPEHRDKPEPCHYIPLNSRGDTIASLQPEGDRDKLEAALLSWLSATIARLQKEVAQEQPTLRR